MTRGLDIFLKYEVKLDLFGAVHLLAPLFNNDVLKMK